MRHLRITLGVAIATCAFAVAAAPALAHEFISSGGHSKGKGGEQVINLGPFHITCKKAKANGGPTTPLSSETFFTSVRFKMCRTLAHIQGPNTPIHLATRFATPMDIEYHANGFVEIGSEGEEIEGQVKVSGGEVTLRIHAIKCTIRIPEQTIPRVAEKKPNAEYESAIYTNLPAKHKLLIANDFKKMHFEYGGGQCEGFGTSEEELHGGNYVGELVEEIPHGSLEFQ